MKKKQDTQTNQRQSPTEHKEPSPITSDNEIPQNPDPHIDQDFPGFPHSPSKEGSINPQTTNEKLESGTVKKSGTGVNRENNSQPEQGSDGSANAFEQSENSAQPELKKKRKRNYPSY